MTFLWPELLWLLGVVPLLIAGYVLLLRRKKKQALRYASLGMVRDALGARQRFRRHVPPLLFLVALVILVVATARPTAKLTLRRRRRAQSHRRRTGRRARLCGGAAVERAHRRGVVRRDGLGRPASDP
jgi:Aerotolerance regulator N-terminal